MGTRTTYAPGTFCWVELGTPDPAGAASFYASVLGWNIDEADFEQGTYRTARVVDLATAGIYESVDQPTSWSTYVSVEDTDMITKQAEQLGATVLVQPMDIGTMGRMAVIQDPSGAVFSVWRGGDTVGAQIVNDPGAFCITQLNAQDPTSARSFYEQLFEWRFEQVSPDPDSYWSIYVGESLNAGMMQSQSPTPDYWLTYFTTPDSLDDALSRIGEGGGTIAVPPTAVPSGRFLVAQDPQGGYFGLFEGRTDD